MKSVGGLRARSPFPLLEHFALRPVRGIMVATPDTDPIEELRKWCAAEVEILDRALAVVRHAFSFVDEILSEEQSRDADPAPGPVAGSQAE